MLLLFRHSTKPLTSTHNPAHRLSFRYTGGMSLAEHERAVSRLLGDRNVKSLFWLCYEGIHCAILLAALVLLFLYVFRDSRTARFASS